MLRVIDFLKSDSYFAVRAEEDNYAWLSGSEPRRIPVPVFRLPWYFLYRLMFVVFGLSFILVVLLPLIGILISLEVVVFPVLILVILQWSIIFIPISLCGSPILGILLRLGLDLDDDLSFCDGWLYIALHMLQLVLIAPFALPFIAIECLIRFVAFCLDGVYRCFRPPVVQEYSRLEAAAHVERSPSSSFSEDWADEGHGYHRPIPDLLPSSLVSHNEEASFDSESDEEYCDEQGWQLIPASLYPNYTHQETVCSITQDIIDAPVVTKCGHFFEKSAIHEWLLHRSTCPLDRQVLTAEGLMEIDVRSDLEYVAGGFGSDSGY